MFAIAQQIVSVRTQIRQAEIDFERLPGSVRLLAVSKTKPSSDIILAYLSGQRHFAESYAQEARSKQQELGAYNITWHFIGPIQSNKTKLIARHFAWVHSVDRFKIAQRLSEQRPANLPALNICLQVNISHESSKSGIALNDLPELIDAVNALPNLRLRGVMAVPAPQSDFSLQREPYRLLYKAVSELRHPNLDTFSFGMSNDLNAAIAEGSTMVRIGTSLFGTRQYS
ncbi:YggS family pyridoxal phosphate-dependent enzyme [Methylotuvimicrobium alcaliphilum]|uniref:Pyridoxal phosphate homeostasis protein n=1 Tax=Methylotuvimicrobium alcaliphilum (strain DSM 19304 / NCIMB 14124 / VKM B-2133 / 20Z) TaxID=1091494 RepID=G4SUJ9_META2|nr:YggS family pyridoxal phosphate-dependent enzyme [Methylotuvimicrobium alcaliphilum]CCE21825.1 Conserved hypothetical protein [Methylotuvimicrobium alcaliphilum 20Z]